MFMVRKGIKQTLQKEGNIVKVTGRDETCKYI
jgi:hypothetical protein